MIGRIYWLIGDWMGILGNLMGKKEEVPVGSKESKSEGAGAGEGKYPNPCSVCGNPGTEKKWAGQYWHVRCLRKSKKMARGML